MGSVECVELLAPFEHACKDGHDAPALSRAVFGRGGFEAKRAMAGVLTAYPCQIEGLGATDLMLCATRGDLEGARKRLGQIGKTDGRGRTALMHAAAMGYGDVVELLTDEAGMQDEDGFTALMFSVKSQAPKCVQTLSGKESKRQTRGGKTALMLAAESGDLESAAILLPSEAGAQGKDLKQAWYYAVKRFDSECCRLLLRDPQERASVPRQMAAAFDGDVRTLQEMRETWEEKIWDELTALDFAAAGRQRRAARVLTRSDQARRFFASMWLYFNAVGDGIGLLSREFLPVAARTCDQERSATFLSLIIRGRTADARMLKPLCQIMPDGETRARLKECMSREELQGFPSLVKNVGTSFAGKTLWDLGASWKSAMADQIVRNPIYSKQIELARKQVQRGPCKDENGTDWVGEIPCSKQFSVRETQSEAAFNRIVLLASRDVSWKAISAQRRVKEPRTSTLRPKQERNRLLIRNTVAYFKAQLRKMMNE